MCVYINIYIYIYIYTHGAMSAVGKLFNRGNRNMLDTTPHDSRAPKTLSPEHPKVLKHASPKLDTNPKPNSLQCTAHTVQR